MKKRLMIHLAIVMAISVPLIAFASSAAHGVGKLLFPLDLSAYHDGDLNGLSEVLGHRIATDPLNLVVSIIFLCAILHTFAASKFLQMAHDAQHSHEEGLGDRKDHHLQYKGEIVAEVSFKAQLYHFLGEVEAVFGLWTIPLFGAIAYFHGLHAPVDYINTVNFTEPMFVVVIMTLASTRPIVKFAESMLEKVASIGKNTPGAWWFTILTIGPILGSFITEPAAMTISALILAKQFYNKKPSAKFAYATIGLLFVNVSVGGTLSHFAAPPVLMVAGPWGWDLPFMFLNFGWKAVLGILISNTLYFMVFKGEFAKLSDAAVADKNTKVDWNDRPDPVPARIILAYALFMVWTVANAHYPPLFIGGFLFFLGYHQATGHHQNRLDLKPSLLVGFFLAGLVTHGGVQAWWIAPILGSLQEVPLMIGATVLTAFNDNAAITFLSTLVPDFSDGMKYAVVAGAVTGGGLTVIANAPNPAGQSILAKFFDGGVSPMKLAMSALVPTIIMGLCFMLLR